jgi:hypothetical protein
MNKIKSVLSNRVARGAVGSGLLLAVLAVTSPAFATSINPSSAITTFAGSSISQLVPIVLIVASAVVLLLVVMWGVNKVLNILRGRYRV